MPYVDKEKAKQYHKDYNREYMKKSRLENPEKFKAREKKWRESNRLQSLIYSTKQTAKKKGLNHDISIEDLIQVEMCPLTGILIDWGCSGRHLSNPSIDRIDPSKGYVKGNVEIMSCLGNSMKNAATREQLVYFAKEILKRYDPSSLGC